MKLKRLLSLVAMIFALGGGSLWADTDKLTTANGWTKVTDLGSINLGDYYFAFVDNNQDLMLSFEEGNNQSTVDGRKTMVYINGEKAEMNPNMLWIIESSADNAMIRNVESTYFMQCETNWSDNAKLQPWYCHTNDVTSSTSGGESWARYDLVYANDMWTIRNKKVTSGNEKYLGPWDNVIKHGAEVAANKATAGTFQIYAIPRSMVNYTKGTASNPANYTYKIVNHSFERNSLTSWESTGVAFERKTTSPDYNPKVGTAFVEKWTNSGALDFSQTVNDLPVGKYRVCARIRNDADAAVSLYANDEQITVVKNNTAEYYVDVVLTNQGNIKFGVKCENHPGKTWLAVDEFSMYYFGNGVENYATELPTGATTADSWYKYTINVASDYKITSSAAATIKYTQDGTLEASAVTTSVNLTAGASSENIHLEPGVIYVSPSAASIITIAADNKIYSVGSATVDKAYVQPGQTVTITYADANTNDGTASLGLNGTPAITFGSESVTATAIANGFTFVVPNVTAGADYTLAIPADAFGYVGHALNEAQNITIKTPAIYDGTYYFYNTYVKKYMSRGGVWATSAIFDDWGLAINLRTDADGMTTFQYFDNQRYLYNQGWSYGDGTTAMKFKASATDGGYEFQNMDGNNANTEFLAHWGGRVVSDARKGDNLDHTSNVWTIETLDEHIANYARNTNNQAKLAAAAAGFSAQNAADLETEIVGYTNVEIPVTGQKAERWQWYAAEKEAHQESEYYKEVVNNIPSGFYKLTVDAFQRAAWNNVVAAADGARGLIYLYANGAKTQLKSVMEYGANEAYTQGSNPDYSYDGKHYPNSFDAGIAALETGNYQNVVYVYVPTDAGKTTGTLTIGINNPVRQGGKLNTDTWAIYNNWKLEFICKEATDYVAEGVRHYIGDYENMAVETTDETPIVDLTLANVSGTVSITTTNPNGLVYTTNNISGSNVVVDGTCDNLVLTDGYPFKAHKNFEATSATYTMGNVAETSAGKTFGTLMVPFAVSGVPANNTAYALTEVAFGEEIHAGTVGTIAANAPVLVTKSGDYTASNVQVAATNDTYENGQLIGTYKQMDAPVSSYVLQKHDNTRVAFFMVNDVQPKVNPFRAYIKAQSAGARDFLNVVFDDETAINEIENTNVNNDGVIYDLAGRRVNNAVKGIYIINGKKVIK